MKTREIYEGIIIDEKQFKKQKRIYKTLINDLQKAINKYTSNSMDGYGASLLSKQDLIEWNKLGNPSTNDFYWQKIPSFWGMGIALTYYLAPIPVEDLL
ncbi:SusD/RagB family nutrient-binding outer membrane lipoprotein [Mucilaginibacter sp. SG564]|uniref:SusD/RagB family nutrient-binding outer membrane lipoprotein n=1 Tax=Mucilaginibacter sp. SG564 TaxID=2587022 RepID=UPI00155450DD|nr:SusD/RagB family nutrient-binding outer membrane lipoprotein [Mucilaginibacter sp. SG564]NOW94004.1 arabinogalactan endo-1,4-beta-galactosidase [Mucilaginibacter sp. SG564]